MIRLTVLYNLPEGADEAEFIKWRLTEHQASNESMSGVLSTDFARIESNWPEGTLPDYQFQTTAEWADQESFEHSFYREDVQAKLQEDLKRLGDYTFFVSRLLTASGTGAGEDSE